MAKCGNRAGVIRVNAEDHSVQSEDITRFFNCYFMNNVVIKQKLKEEKECEPALVPIRKATLCAIASLYHVDKIEAPSAAQVHQRALEILKAMPDESFALATWENVQEQMFHFSKLGNVAVAVDTQVEGQEQKAVPCTPPDPEQKYWLSPGLATPVHFLKISKESEEEWNTTMEKCDRAQLLYGLIRTEATANEIIAAVTALEEEHQLAAKARKAQPTVEM